MKKDMILENMWKVCILLKMCKYTCITEYVHKYINYLYAFQK